MFNFTISLFCLLSKLAQKLSNIQLVIERKMLLANKVMADYLS